MIEYIALFLEEKSVSESTKKSYTYDLRQFLHVIENSLSQEKLTLYKKSLASLSPSARKRKYSTVNQFLLFLYQRRYCQDYYQLDEKIRLGHAKKRKSEPLDPSIFHTGSQNQVGQLIALLISELGLLPNEIARLKTSDYDPTFHILKVESQQTVRILRLSKVLVSFLDKTVNEKQLYLFDKEGHPYSRQWFFNHLKAYFTEIGLADYSAQKLREQFILKEVNAGKTMIQLSQELGLKSPITLEKYYRT
ncbi:site-specific tyrosine recombinase XerD [Streptococcus catagoni]|uniref:site-specific tyrosine recombinase XerD n=1 Tax=Streptococcus catagoni TaxID=2654874 RepID=UPI00140D2A65|nr:site-specific tyrosine recombinase XerD [Streptococcus catagoni]